MKVLPLPSQELLLSVFGYDPLTGRMWWLKNGVPAFVNANTHGHLQGKFRRKTYLAHRIAWKMVTGSDPDVIDHDNRVRSDNRWSNLNSGTQSDNSKNTKLRTDNTSGRPGVSWHKRLQKWQAYIGHKRRIIPLGTFDELAPAVAAREAAEKLYKFHPNHGRG